MAMDQQFIRYLFNTIWRTHFQSKRKMAAALDVTYRYTSQEGQKRGVLQYLKLIHFPDIVMNIIKKE